MPDRAQGRSLVPLVRDSKPPAGWRTEFFYEHLTFPNIIPPAEGVRTERWKYFRWVGAEPVIEELYDLQAAPLEERNLAARREHAATLRELRARWQALREELK